MSDIIKTWPSFMPRRKVMQIFNNEGKWSNYYFSVGRGKPQQAVEHIWFTHGGTILGRFRVTEFVFNENERTLPRLMSIENHESQWQFRPGIWVAVCNGKFMPEPHRYRFAGFRGWRYFNFEEHISSIDSVVAV